MNAKAYLQQIKKLDVLIDNKLEQSDQLRDRATSTTAAPCGDRVQSTSKGDSLERIIIKIVDMEADLERQIDRLVDLKTEVMSTIDQLENPNQINLLYKRYIKFEAWDKIAEDMNYSIQAVFKQHGIALQQINRLINKDEEPHARSKTND